MFFLNNKNFKPKNGFLVLMYRVKFYKHLLKKTLQIDTLNFVCIFLKTNSDIGIIGYSLSPLLSSNVAFYW